MLTLLDAVAICTSDKDLRFRKVGGRSEFLISNGAVYEELFAGKKIRDNINNYSLCDIINLNNEYEIVNNLKTLEDFKYNSCNLILALAIAVKYPHKRFSNKTGANSKYVEKSVVYMQHNYRDPKYSNINDMSLKEILNNKAVYIIE